jgi:quercetin dioxygenase-like cupin family protein
MTEQAMTRILIADHELPREFPTRHVEVRRITLGPDVPVGPHSHNGPVFGVIMTGSVNFQIGDGDVVILRAGDVFHEPGDDRISQFDATAEGVEFLAWFPLPAGELGAVTPLP